ncbi:hypothetical protein ARHIZOSPH14_13750 [Agromyces rhizosphaerae]|uniref:DUF3800 domain-containing protein n=1 Tax=Agromyces rhizosphaerae TaxID=88374 RepID=A0A9W6CRE7_9MICO|nr:hypothetical protein [Agromyces rhizosphaerae]GLI27133.1 hypothetical protein ARHIZOSPH14_13750 [Agromyces rhizosphaerae]
MPFSAGDRVFVDESKSGGYYIAAAATASTDVASIERRLRGLRAGGRSAIHFNDESKRRDQLIRALCELEVRVHVYVMRRARDTVARPALLRALVADLIDGGAADLTLERDASLEAADRRVIRGELDRLGALTRLKYGHRGRTEQPMLWIADAVAWCEQKGGVWPQKVAPIVARRVVIDPP